MPAKRKSSGRPPKVKELVNGASKKVIKRELD